MKEDSSSFEGYALGRIKRELLRKLGRGDEALDMAWTAFKACPGKYAYDDLMANVPGTERAAWHRRAMDGAANAGLLSQIELWFETKEIDRLVQRLRKVRDHEIEDISHYVMAPIAKKLAKQYPDVAGKVYRALGMRILNAKKSKYYDVALENLGNARRCYDRAGDSEAWPRLVVKIRAEHHRKTGFIGGFESMLTGAGRASRQSFLVRAKARWSLEPEK